MIEANKNNNIGIIRQIILVAAPWALFNRPSIQIGALKAYLNLHLPKIEVTALHLFLHIAERIGYATYQALSERTWLAETVYAAMLYPDRLLNNEKLYRRYAANFPALKNLDFRELVRRVESFSDDCIQQVDWKKCDMAGFSVSLCQLTASLYLMKQIKQINPDLIVVVGGSTFSGSSSRDYLDHFAQIDFIVKGEGEKPLVDLIESYNAQDGIHQETEIAGLVSRGSSAENDNGFSQVERLEKLPCPDYDEYFEQIEQFNPEKRFFPTISVEASRGCWWKRSNGMSEKNGCAFCNLNLQWQGYRKKSSTQVVKEIDSLTSRYKTLSIAFMDNVLPAEKTKGIFTRIDRLNKDLKLFGEIRADTSVRALKRMRSAGMQEVQVGIESLSNGLLKRMNKGTSVIQNLEIMKHCETLGLKNSANLIIHFPGSDEKDVAETLETLDFALPFQPLKPVRFWLGQESPIWRNQQRFNIKSMVNHPGYRDLFPEQIERKVNFIIQSYRGDLTLQKKIWKPVEKKIAQWQATYTELHANRFSEPILSFRDGDTFLIIKQRRYRAEPLTHRLTGLSRDIYLFCHTHRSIKHILTSFPDLTEDKVLPFLRMMTGKRLMFRENDQYLSLASPVGRQF